MYSALPHRRSAQGASTRQAARQEGRRLVRARRARPPRCTPPATTRARSSCGPKAVAVKDDDAETLDRDRRARRSSAGKNEDARAAYDKALAHATHEGHEEEGAARARRPRARDRRQRRRERLLQAVPRPRSRATRSCGSSAATRCSPPASATSRSTATPPPRSCSAAIPPRRVEVVARRGQALEGMGKDDEAVAEYRRAIKLAPKGYYLEVELTGRIIDIYRRKQALAALLAAVREGVARGRARPLRVGHARQALRGDRRAGQGDRRAQEGGREGAVRARDPAPPDRAARELGPRRRGARAVRGASSAPRRARRGSSSSSPSATGAAARRRRRSRRSTRLEERFPSDPSVLGAIADFYTRWGKDDLAIAEYERLAKLEPDDPATSSRSASSTARRATRRKAIATWQRITTQRTRRSACAKLGEVLAEHGSPAQPTEALDELRQGDRARPQEPRVLQGPRHGLRGDEEAARRRSPTGRRCSR